MSKEMSLPGMVMENPALTAFERATDQAHALITQAIEKNMPVETMERLLSMRTQLRAEAARGAFLDAMARFQHECPVITKNRVAKIRSKSGAEFGYRYADIGEIVKVAAPLLTKHGLSFTIKMRLEPNPPAQVATCVVSHVLGHSEESEFRAPIDVNAAVSDMQKAAAAQTFAKRIAFSNAFGILTTDDDDDGTSGGENGEPKKHVEPPRAKSEPKSAAPVAEPGFPPPSGNGGGAPADAGDGKLLSDGAKATLAKALARVGKAEADLIAAGFPALAAMPFARFNDAMKAAKAMKAPA